MSFQIYMGDFNIQINKEPMGTNLFNKILNDFGLNQCLTGPTHMLGNTLNLIMCKSEQKLEVAMAVHTI